MYINKIDALIDQTINYFYLTVTSKKINFTKVLRDDNFVKHQSFINTILVDFSKTIDEKEIRKIVNNQDNVKRIQEILKRYVAYYLFLLIGYHYKGRRETYINNVIEFGKNQSGFKFHVNNFFNSENNSNIIKFYNTTKQIQEILEMDSGKIAQILKRDEYSATIKFLNELGQDFVNKNFKLENLKNDKNQQAHNILKVIIIRELYVNEEKKDVHRILTEAEEQDGEFTFIDIVLPTRSYIDFTTIENILTEDEINTGLSSSIYNFLTENEDNITISSINKEEKIKTLIKNKVVTPIADDFMLYHKDNEKYDKGQDMSDRKKKEDTRIKYIVNKIEKVSKYNDKDSNKKEIDNLFYRPLNDRRAILFNNSEDLKVISKLENLGRRVIESNEFFQDLMQYRIYPYINFKTMSKDGFNIKMEDTVNTIRYVTIDKKLDRNKPVETRIGNKNVPLNIIGFVIPTNTKALQCLQVKDLIDIRSLSKKGSKNVKFENGYYGTLKFMRNVVSSGKKFKSSVYWLFDLEKDRTKMEGYEKAKANDVSETIKLMISEFYDDVEALVVGEVLKRLDKFKELEISKSFKIANKVQKNFFKLPENNSGYIELEKFIFFNKSITTEAIYDKKEDSFPGLFGEVIKLPEFKENNKRKIPKLLVDQQFVEVDMKEEITEAEKVGAKCQHFVSWEKITAIRKNNPSEFSERLFEFIQQYLMESFAGKYVCKSCSTELDLQKYVTDGVYDRSTGSFVTFTSNVDTPLEDIPKYEKYRQVIVNLEKIIERLASAMNISYYVGASSTSRTRRRRVVRETIDMVLEHNVIMKNTFKSRKQKIEGLYGISEDLTRLFVFDLENSIYVFTSEEKDYYKSFKQNNILSYMLIIMISELGESQIYQFIGDNKVCNYYFYNRQGRELFDKMKVITNNNKDVKPVLNYDALTYILYYASCMIVKYDMWNSRDEENEKTQKKGRVDRLKQKIIISTVLDILNSLLEINSRKNKSYLYEMFGNKFLYKLQSIFSKNSITDTLDKMTKKRIVTVDNKRRFVSNKIPSIKLLGTYDMPEHKDYYYIPNRLNRMYVPRIKNEPVKYTIITNLSNASDGEFYDWTPKNGVFVSKNNGIFYNELKFNESESSKIRVRYREMMILRNAILKCKNTNFNKVLKNINMSCEELNNKDVSSVKLEKINQEFENIVNKKNELENKLIEKTKNKLNEKHKQFKNAHEELKNSFSANNKKRGVLDFVDNFIYLIQGAIGKDANINNQNIFLKERVYIIDHDRFGNDIAKPVLLKSNAVTMKREHGFFKRDVLYYTDHEKGRLDIYYDATSRILLGYKEQNKDYVLSNVKRYIKINYSVEEMIKLFGYDSFNINIRERVKSLRKLFKNIKNDEERVNKIVNTIVSDILRKRIDRIKMLINNLQRNIYRVKYNYKDKPLFEDEENLEKEDTMDKYRKLLSNMELRDPKGKHRVFKKSNKILNTVFFKDINKDNINLDLSGNIIDANDLNFYDNSGNLLLYHMISELSNLLNYNMNKFNKTNISYMIINLIMESFKNYNLDYRLEKHPLKRFTHVLESSDYAYDITEAGAGIQTQTDGLYQEYQDPEDDKTEEEIEKNYEAKQEMEGLDMDTMANPGEIQDTDEMDNFETSDYDLARSNKFYGLNYD
tara:strand:- start:1661 stop:6595 length:4935 start_codon:yes stop_codon:yes gene_type:complete